MAGLYQPFVIYFACKNGSRVTVIMSNKLLNKMIKTILLTAAGVIVGLIVYELGKNMLGLNSYEENYDLLAR